MSSLLADASTVEREFGSLEAIGENYPQTVVSLDRFDRSRTGMCHRHLID